MRSSHAILEGPMAGPADPPFTGLCADCGEDFTERTFTITWWPAKARTVCAWCAQSWAVKALQQAQSDGNEDVLGILQSVDEIAKCKGCDRFVCGCRDE